MAAPLGLREVGCVSLVALTAAYLRWLQRRLPPGVRRLAAALPVVAAFLLAPLLFDPWSEPAHVILAINLPWLSNSAVLGWAAGRGPLAQPRLPFHAFLAFLGAPALPAALEPAFPPYRFSLAAAAARAALLAAAAYGMACYRLAPWAVGVLQCEWAQLSACTCLLVFAAWLVEVPLCRLHRSCCPCAQPWLSTALPAVGWRRRP